MTVSDLYRYSDTLFSVRVSMTLSVTRTSNEGGTKTFPMDNTFFFTKSDGKWLVTNMVNGNAQEKIEKVRNPNGTTTMRIVFTPDETGAVYLTDETKLEPMTLVAVFKTPDGE